MNTLLKLTMLLCLSAFATACGVIPSEYRGQFKDADTGAMLTLKGKKGEFRTSDGRSLVAKAKDLEFESLSQAESGIYVSIDPGVKNILEVYWVAPDRASRQHAEQVVWFQSEVIYTELNLNQKDKVDALEFFHCREGTVLLDLATKRWQVGCPANPEYLRMRRVKK